MSSRVPVVTKFCGCVTDLKTAVIIIAVYGIVTCPPISWALMRHTYAIRISCIASVNKTQSDVIDISFRNIISFGLGVNSGYGTSCFKPDPEGTTKKQENVLRFKIQVQIADTYKTFIKCFIWAVFIADLILIISSIVFLYNIFTVMRKIVFDVFMYSVMVSVVASFLYAIIYLLACSSSGYGFPVLEMFFAIFDLLLWTYFLIVIGSYRKTIETLQQQQRQRQQQQQQ